MWDGVGGPETYFSKTEVLIFWCVRNGPDLDLHALSLSCGLKHHFKIVTSSHLPIHV